MTDNDSLAKFDALMDLFDEGLDAMTDAEVLAENQETAERDQSTFHSILQGVVHQHKKSLLSTARRAREHNLATLQTGSSQIPEEPVERQKLYRRVIQLHPKLTLAARDESGLPDSRDIESALRKFEALGILRKFVEDGKN